MSASILDHPAISSRYFFPRLGRLDAPFWVDCGTHKLACHLHAPHPGARTLVHFHGNGEIVPDYLGDFVEAVASLGLNTFLVEYRGYGQSEGEPALTSMLDDVEVALEALGKPAQELILFGRSVGSIYAIHGASRWPEVAALVIESGIADPLQRVLLRVRPDEIGATMAAMQEAADQHLNHQRKMGAYTGPTLIMHTLYDNIVHVDHAERLAQWSGAEATLEIFSKGDHNSILYANAPAYFAALKALIDGLPPLTTAR